MSINNLNSSLETLFGKMENFISTKTVVGEPVSLGGVILVPLVDVAFGVGAGMSDSRDEKGNLNGGGGLGGKITPVAVLVIIDGTVQLVNVREQDNVKKLLDMAPGILSKLNLGSLFSKKQPEDKKETKIVFEETTVAEACVEQPNLSPAEAAEAAGLFVPPTGGSAETPDAPPKDNE
jgi:uncharacterized spore protein YtfJ